MTSKLNKLTLRLAARSVCWSAGLAVLTVSGSAQAASDVVEAGQASVVTAEVVEPAARAERGLGRFFSNDEPVLCAPAGARGIPMHIREWAKGEPDPEPFRGMQLEPMFDADGRPLLAACFSYDEPPAQEVVQLFEFAMGMGDRFQPGNRWTGSNGSPISLTWSFVPDTVSIGSGVGEPTANSSLFATMDAQFGSRAAWVSLFQQCFDRWAYVTGTSYTRITAAGVDWDDGANWGSGGNSARGQIRIGMKPIDGGNGVLAYNSFPQNGDMVLDSGENWGGQSGSNWRFLRNTIMHEHGHGLGFNHVCPTNQTKLMEPFLSTNFDGPRADELRGASNFYGDAFGGIASIAAAFDLGTLVPSTTYNPTSVVTGGSVPNGSLASIDLATESDFFKVTTTTPLLCSITVTPTGGSYADYPQDANCNNTVVNTAANSMADLLFEVQNAAGNVLLSRNLNSYGLSESYTGFLLSPAGPLYIRVRHNSAATYNGVQLYALSIVTQTAPVVSADDALATDVISLSWTSIANASQYTVYRNTVDNRAGATLIATVDAPLATYEDNSAFGGFTYFYWVEVVQSGGPAKPLNTAGEQGSVAAPTNNNCGSAQLLSGTLPIVEPFANFGATTDGVNTCPSVISNDVWYRWTATGTGTLTVSTCGAPFDTSVAVYSGISCPPGAPLGCSDNSNDCGPASTASSASVPVTSGTAYLIRVGGGTPTSQGVAALTLNLVVANPTGSCCFPDGTCSVLTQANCSGGVWTSGANCSPNPCPQPTGSCCFPDGTCSVFTQANCLLGAWTPGGNCTPNVCPQPTGACCTGVACSVLSVANCGTASGSFLGIGVVCQGTPGNPITCCRANVDLVGGVNADDIFSYLDLWFAQSGSVGPGNSADFDQNNTVNADDIFAFLDAWFAGCD